VLLAALLMDLPMDENASLTEVAALDTPSSTYWMPSLTESLTEVAALLMEFPSLAMLSSLNLTMELPVSAAVSAAVVEAFATSDAAVLVVFAMLEGTVVRDETELMLLILFSWKGG
jgi:hypothetical protein